MTLWVNTGFSTHKLDEPIDLKTHPILNKFKHTSLQGYLLNSAWALTHLNWLPRLHHI